MRKLSITTAAGALTLALAGCYDKDEANYSDNGYNAAEAAANGAYDAGSNGTAYASNWPEGARIVVENGVTYRIDPGGARVQLGAQDSRIEIVDGIRYRVDPGGTRVRIDDQGVAVRIGPGGVDATVPVSNDTTVSVNSN
jgi:hypothetical protein